MWFDTTTRKISNVDFKREDSFVLLANHVYQNDVIKVALPFKRTPVFVSSEFLLSVKGLKILLNHVAMVIPKSKGASDIRTAKSLIRYVRKGYPIMIMPEGDSTYFGETGYIEESTAKLIKKLGVDVITARHQGGFLAKPRWAIGKRKRRYIEVTYKVAIKAEDIPSMTSEEIYEVIKKELYNNDYEWQREVMHPYGGVKLAEGLENVLYKCPECGAINTMTTDKNKLICTACNAEGKVNKYGFIEGYKFDNLVDWDKYQRDYIQEVREAKFSTTADLVFIDNKKFTRTKPEKISLAYHDGKLFIKGKVVEEYSVSEIHNPVLTLRKNLSFDHDGVTYLMNLDRFAMSFLRACQSKY